MKIYTSALIALMITANASASEKSYYLLEAGYTCTPFRVVLPGMEAPTAKPAWKGKIVVADQSGKKSARSHGDACNDSASGVDMNELRFLKDGNYLIYNKNKYVYKASPPVFKPITTGETQQRASNDLLITGKTFFGISVGDNISQHSDKIKKGVLKKNGRSYNALFIQNGHKRLGRVKLDAYNKSIKHIIVESSSAITGNGIKIGSTWGDLKKTIPAIEIHSSIEEHRTYASSGNISYQLNDYFDKSSLSKAKTSSFRDYTKIRAIWID